MFHVRLLTIKAASGALDRAFRRNIFLRNIRILAGRLGALNLSQGAFSMMSF